MSSDVIAEQLSFDAFERALTTVSNAPSTSTRFVEPPTLEESLERVRSHGVVADAADAYGAYVSLTRSGLWRDIAPRRDTRSGGLIYLMCEPRETPTERRKGEPREKRSRSIAVPFAVTRACVTPAFLDVALYLGANDAWPWTSSTDAGSESERPTLLVMIDSDGTTTTSRLYDGFLPPADVPEKTGDGDDSDDDGDDATRPNANITKAKTIASDGESDEDLLDDDRALTLAQKHARPDAASPVDP